MNLLRAMVDEKHPLEDMALLVRRAGLEHLVYDPTSEEVVALAEAGDRLVLIHNACLVKALMDPAQALKGFDDGALARAQTKAMAFRGR